jgi:CHRD domain
MTDAAKTSAAVLGAGTALALGLALAALVSPSGSASPLVGTTSETETTETTEQPTTTKLRAAITARAEVPKPTGVKANAGGTFAVTLTERSGKYSVRWTLTYRNLTGPATAAHVHRARVGKAGPVVLALCGPCRTGRTRAAPVSKTIANAMKGGLTYVNVHTARNQAGEIRGQIRKVG